MLEAVGTEVEVVALAELDAVPVLAELEGAGVEGIEVVGGVEEVPEAMVEEGETLLLCARTAHGVRETQASTASRKRSGAMVDDGMVNGMNE